jgi:hypothetical protein
MYIRYYIINAIWMALLAMLCTYVCRQLQSLQLTARYVILSAWRLSKQTYHMRPLHAIRKKWKRFALKESRPHMFNRRVTRLGEFSPLVKLFSFAIFCKLQMYVARNVGPLFPHKRVYIFRTKNALGFLLGDFFHKLIWSLCSKSAVASDTHTCGKLEKCISLTFHFLLAIVQRVPGTRKESGWPDEFV